MGPLLGINGVMGGGLMVGQAWTLQFYPIVLSLYLWGSEIRNHCFLFFTDNKALVHVINKQSCKDKGLMFFVRKLVLSVCKITYIYLRCP